MDNEGTVEWPVILISNIRLYLAIYDFPTCYNEFNSSSKYTFTLVVL